MQSSVSKRTLSVSLHSIAMLVICLYIVSAIAFDGTGLSSIPIASYSIYLCAGVCVLHVVLSRSFKMNWSYYPLFIFAILLTISYVYSPTREALKSMYLYRFWTAFILYVLITNCIETKDDIKKILISCIVGSVVLSLLIYGKYGFSNLIASGSRLDFKLGDINMLGTYAAFSFVITFVLLVAERKHVIWYVAAIVIMFPMIMFTGSRKSILLIGIGILFFMMFWGNHRAFVGKILLALGCVSIIVLIIDRIPAFSNIRGHFDDLFNLLRGSGELDKGDMNRIMYMKKGWNFFLVHPFAGNGFLSSYHYFGSYTHNNFIELLMNNGAIGFLVYYYLKVKIINKTIKQYNRTNYLLALCLTFSILLLVTDFAVVTYYNRYLIMIIAICVKIVDMEK